MMPFIRGFADELEKTALPSFPPSWLDKDQDMAELTALVEKVAEHEAAYTVRGPASPVAKPAATPKGTFTTHRGHAIKQANLEAPADGMAGSSPMYGTGKGSKLGESMAAGASKALNAKYQGQKAVNTQLGARGKAQGAKAVLANKGAAAGAKAVTANKGLGAGARANQTMSGVAGLNKKAAIGNGLMTPSFMQGGSSTPKQPTSKQPGNEVMAPDFKQHTRAPNSLPAAPKPVTARKSMGDNLMAPGRSAAMQGTAPPRKQMGDNLMKPSAGTGARADRPMTQLPGQLRNLIGKGRTQAAKKSETPRFDAFQKRERENKASFDPTKSGANRLRGTDAQRGRAAGEGAVAKARGLMEGARAVQAQRAAAKAKAGV